ncbi:MAG: peptidylprolyl isomerase [Actinomycetota bacterium]|nr:peptidylprolyl isomerase [Actinomycetota bacterium]
MSIPEGMTVRVHYRGTLDDGTEFDSSIGRDPLEFTVGAGQVIAGFEAAIVDLQVGDSTTVTIPAQDAYGELVPEAIQTVPMEAFAEEPPVGAMVELAAPDGRRLAASVAEVSEEAVTLDFNHPLAGQALTFELELVGTSQAD